MTGLDHVLLFAVVFTGALVAVWTYTAIEVRLDTWRQVRRWRRQLRDPHSHMDAWQAAARRHRGGSEPPR